MRVLWYARIFHLHLALLVLGDLNLLLCMTLCKPYLVFSLSIMISSVQQMDFINIIELIVL